MRRLLVIFLFSAGAFLHLWLTFTDSATEDEPLHIYAGALLLADGSSRVNLEHPPLAKLLAAISLQTMRPDRPEPHPDPGFAVARFFYANRIPTRTILNASRLPFVMMTLALAAIIFRVAHRMFGFDAAILSAVLTLFSPLVFAHGHLVHTDLPVTLLLTAAWLAGMRWLQSDRRSDALIAGTLFGLALLTKFSALIFLAAFILASIRKRRITTVLATAIVVTMLGMMIAFRDLSAPAIYMDGIRVFLARGAMTINYFNGDFSPRGWWFYFPVAFILKTPLSILILLALAIAVRIRKMDRSDALLLVPAVLYFFVSLFSTYNIGLRHLLPMVPFLHLFLARSAAEAEPRVRRVGAGLAAVAVIEALVFFPHLMGFFNPLAGPRDTATFILSDSNVDWGQDNGRMRELLDERQWLPARVLLMGGSLPEVENGPGLTRIDPHAEPQRGTYAVSRALFVELTAFAALPRDHPMRTRLRGQPRFAEPYGLFLIRLSQEGKRVAVVGSSLDVYQVP